MSQRVPDHARVQKPSVYAAHYVAPERERESDEIRTSAAQTARVCALAGHLPHLPPTPAPFGAGVPVPDRRREHGIPVPLAGTRRRP